MGLIVKYTFGNGHTSGTHKPRFEFETAMSAGPVWGSAQPPPPIAPMNPDDIAIEPTVGSIPGRHRESDDDFSLEKEIES